MPESLSIALYIHVPFCSDMCTYCAFNTYVGLEELYPAYVDALIHEIGIIGTNQPDIEIKTIFFGGGTPSLLTGEQYQQIFDAIYHRFRVVKNAEISLESNPNDLSQNYLQELLQVGFNRLSIGMQTAIERDLQLYNRLHTTDTVLSAVSAARDAGFTNISLDLIYGAPQETLTDWERTLQVTLSLSPEHISTYALQLEGGTPLKEWVDNGELPHPDDDISADMYELTTELFKQAGYQQYEISNWSKPGYESLHNIQYWRNLPYLGLGPGAHGYANGIRYSVTRSPHKYIHVLQTANHTNYRFPKSPATARAVRVSREDEISETILMGLRLTQEGIGRESFQQRFGIDIVELRRETIAKYLGFGLLEVDEDKIRLTKSGRLLSNAIIRDLI